MNVNISNRVEQLAPSGIRAFFDLVLGMQDVISLGVGEPDFITPWHIRESAIIVQFLKNRYGLIYDPEDETLITVGVSEGLDLVMRAILNPGDKVLVPEPAYVSYGPVVELAGGKAITINTDLKSAFKMTPSQIEKAYEKGVKALMINYPCNPTGASYTGGF